MNINLGCGKHRIKGFKGVDLQKLPTVDYVCDISKLKFKDDSIDNALASHCLEHFSHTRTLDILGEWYRVLKKDGKLYISVPNWDAVVMMYVKSGVLEDFYIHLIYGNQGAEFENHFTIFNFSRLRGLLSHVGFRKIKQLDNFPFDTSHTCAGLVDNRYKIPISLNIEATK